MNAQLKVDQKEAKAKLTILKAKIVEDIRQLVKEKFNYVIPIAKIDNASINSTGASIENNLPELCKEFSRYRESARLWENLTACGYYYSITNGKLEKQVLNNAK